MVIFKLTSKQGSKNYYNFSAAGLSGSFSIHTTSYEIKILTLIGHYSEDKKEINRLLYIAKSKLTELKFPDSCIYATH